MNLGDLNETVAIIAAPVAATPDAVGGDVLDDETIDPEWWVKVEPLTGTERLGVSDAMTSAVMYRVTGRARDDIDTTMRLIRGSSTLEIATVFTAPRSLWTVCECKEVPRG